MGNSQSNIQDDKYAALKKLYSMNQQEMMRLRKQLQPKNHLDNSMVKETLSNNSIMQRQFIDSLKVEQEKLKLNLWFELIFLTLMENK